MNLLGTKLLRKNHKKIRHLPYFSGNFEKFFRKNEENVGAYHCGRPICESNTTNNDKKLSNKLLTRFCIQFLKVYFCQNLK